MKKTMTSENETRLGYPTTTIRKGDIVWYWIGRKPTTCMALETFRYKDIPKKELSSSRIKVLRGDKILYVVRSIVRKHRENLTRCPFSFFAQTEEEYNGV